MNLKSFFLISIFSMAASIHAGGKISCLSKTAIQTIRHTPRASEKNFTVIVVAIPSPSTSTGPEESAKAHPFGISDEASSELTAQLIDQLRAQLEDAQRRLKIEQKNPMSTARSPFEF